MKKPNFRVSVLAQVWAFTSVLSLVSACLVGCGDGGDDPGSTGGRGSNDEGGDSGSGGGNPGQGGSGTGGGTAPSSCDDINCVRGTCDDSSGVALCECTSGFAGPECEDIDECQTESCGVGGQCTNTFGGFYCACDFGFVSNGSTCENVDECDDSPCADDATCTDSAGTYSCACDDGPSYGNGYFCAASDPCAGNPCGSGATCIGTAGGHVCQCPAGKAGTTNCAATCATLPVTDAGLIDAIEGLLGVDIEDVVPSEDLVGQTSLTTNNLVYSLDGLECWPNLEFLTLNNARLSGAPTSDPTPTVALGSMNRLRGLVLGCTEISSLDVLEDHPALTSFTVSQQACPNDLTDFSALSSLKQLESLTLTGVELGNASFVSVLPGLRTLDLSQNSLASVGAFTALPLLQQLGLSANELDDVAALGGLANLVTLDVSYNDIGSLAWVTTLTKLEELYASDNDIATLPSLASLAGLRVLFLANNQVAALSALAPNSSLTIVDLSNNEIADLEPLVDSDLHGDLAVFTNPLDCSIQKALIKTLAGQGLRVASSCP